MQLQTFPGQNHKVLIIIMFINIWLYILSNIKNFIFEGSQFLSNYRLTIFSQTNGCGGVAEIYEYKIDKVRG